MPDDLTPNFEMVPAAREPAPLTYKPAELRPVELVSETQFEAGRGPAPGEWAQLPPDLQSDAQAKPFPPLLRLRLVTAALEACGWLEGKCRKLVRGKVD
jgi:hypothetical protein